MAFTKAETVKQSFPPLARLPYEYLEMANFALVAADTCAGKRLIPYIDRNLIAATCAMLEIPAYITGNWVREKIRWGAPKLHQEQTENLTAMSFAQFSDWFYKRTISLGLPQSSLGEITTEISQMKNEIEEWKRTGRRPNLREIFNLIGKEIA